MAKPLRPPNVLPNEVLKEKATFNLSVELLQELEDKWIAMRKITGSKQISKTLIVEQALKMAFVDFDERNKEGEFYFNVVANKDKLT